MNNIYLISSNSIRLADDEIKNIVGDNQFTTYDLNSALLDDVLEEASYFSLFDDLKYIVCKNANIFTSSRKSSSEEETTSKKDANLIKYLDEPNSNTILIFVVNGKVDGKKKIVKTIKDRYKLIEIADMKAKDLFTKISDTLKKDKYKIDTNTLYYIINSCYNNYDLIMNEIDKIKLYYNDKKDIKYDDVINIVSRNLEDNNFKFIEVIMDKNIKESFKIFDDLMIQKIEPIMLMSMLAKEIRNTLLVKQMVSNRINRKEIMITLGINFDFQMDKFINYSYSYDEKQLEDYLVMICDFDYKIKRGKINNKLALELIIMQMCK